MNDEKYRILIAKTDRKNSHLWLPLWMHLRDTAGVMKKLIHEWLPEAAIVAAHMEYSSFERAAVFLAALHDVGKATSSFQYMISRNLDGKAKELLNQRFSLNEHYPHTHYTPHAYSGRWILQSHSLPFQLPESYASVIGAHHGKPFTGTPSGSEDLVELWPKNFYGTVTNNEVIENWKRVWKCILHEAYTISNNKEDNDLPVLTGEAQVLLSGLLIIADWIASNTVFFPLIDAEKQGSLEDYPQRTDLGWYRANMPEGWHSELQQMSAGSFQEQFGFMPNQVQQAVLEVANHVGQPGLFILESLMGSGKTEAALAFAEVIAGRYGQGASFLDCQPRRPATVFLSGFITGQRRNLRSIAPPYVWYIMRRI